MINMPDWCKYIMQNKNVSSEEMKVYNCGIGYVLIVDSSICLDDYIKIGYLLGLID